MSSTTSVGTYKHASGETGLELLLTEVKIENPSINLLGFEA